VKTIVATNVSTPISASVTDSSPVARVIEETVGLIISLVAVSVPELAALPAVSETLQVTVSNPSSRAVKAVEAIVTALLLIVLVTGPTL